MSNEGIKVTGTPTPSFMSAHSYDWKHIEGPFAIEVPFKKGDLIDGVNTVVNAVTNGVADDIDVRVNLGTVMKFMFSDSVYPKLEEGQFFAISDLLLDNKKGVLTIVGNIIENVDK